MSTPKRGDSGGGVEDEHKENKESGVEARVHEEAKVDAKGDKTALIELNLVPVREK